MRWHGQDLQNKFWTQTKAESAPHIRTNIQGLNNAFELPVGAWSAVTSKAPHVGCTAVALEYVQALTARGWWVCYADLWSSVIGHRLVDVDLERLTFLRPRYVTTLRTLIQDVHQLVTNNQGCPPLAVVVDGLSVFTAQDGTTVALYRDFMRSLRTTCPGLTVLMVDNTLSRNEDWGALMTLTPMSERSRTSEDLLDDQTEIGSALVRVEGPLGVGVVCIEHLNGRVSPAYDHAQHQILNEGAFPSGQFELQDVRARGVWKFVNEHARWRAKKEQTTERVSKQ